MSEETTSYENNDAVKVYWKALANVQATLDPAKKDSKNPHLGNRYADLASCWDALKAVLPDNGFSVVQYGVEIGGKPWLCTELGHSSGHSIKGVVPLLYMDAKGLNVMQALGSAWTYARKYGLAAISGLTAEDDDAEGAGGGMGTPIATPRSPSASPSHAPAAPKTKAAPRQASAPRHNDAPLESVVGSVEKVTMKEGTKKDGSAWILYGIKLDNGKWYSTFSDSIGTAAKEVEGMADVGVVITYKLNEKGYPEAQTLRLVEEEKDGEGDKEQVGEGEPDGLPF